MSLQTQLKDESNRSSQLKQVADEAIFQLSCGKEFAGWMFALMTAIQDDHKHSGGSNSAGLSALGAYLAEGCLADAEHNVDTLDPKLAQIWGAV
jgi:hypothetical protein